jgi:hypothetical protein
MQSLMGWKIAISGPTRYSGRVSCSCDRRAPTFGKQFRRGFQQKPTGAHFLSSPTGIEPRAPRPPLTETPYPLSFMTHECHKDTRVE